VFDSESSGGESEGESTTDGDQAQEGGAGDKPKSKRQQKKHRNQIVAQNSSSVAVVQQFPRRVTEKDLMEKAIPSNYHAPQPTRNMPHKHPGSPTLTRNIQQPK